MDSVRCDYWADGANQCLAPAYETLRNLCMDHYRELVIRPTWLKYCEIETEWYRVQNELYNVECALGYRARTQQLAAMVREDVDKAMVVSFHSDPPRAKRPPRTVSVRKSTEQLIDDGEINNDI